jgi:hypothetical protein
MRTKVSVLPKLTKKQKKLLEKENGWVLNCISEKNTKLKPYNLAVDKLAKHFVVCIPKKKKVKEELISSAKFRTFLLNEKSKILRIQNTLTGVWNSEPSSSK